MVDMKFKQDGIDVTMFNLRKTKVFVKKKSRTPNECQHYIPKLHALK